MIVELPWEIERATAKVRDRYVRMIESGTTPRLALMLALQQPPGTRGTDRSFMQGKLNDQWLGDLPKFQADRILAGARAAGISTTGKFYCSGIADKRGHMDPEAWVDSVDDVKKVARRRNLQVRGIVDVDADFDRPPTEVALNPRIEKRLAKEAIKKDPKLSMADARALVRDRHAPHWKKKA